MKRVKIGVFVSAVIFLSLAQGDQSTQTALATAKMAGACGILDQMIHFQKTTRIEGGDLFVTRFWETEAARLGMDVQGLSNLCDKSILTYESLFQTAGTPPR